MTGPFKKGRGAQVNPPNRFHKSEMEPDPEWLHSEETPLNQETQFFEEHSKTIVNKVPSPDVGMNWSANPYQGCEHGCAYCYARNSHNYWGFSAGTDFEQKIIVKKDAPALLRQFLANPRWKPEPIVFSGNTDCYQPAERKYCLTKQMLEVMVECHHPVGIITKNALLLRDLNLLQTLAEQRLVHVYLSITTLNEELLRKMEPRTTAVSRKLEAIERLANAGVPVGVMTAPIIPGLNDHEIPAILQAAANAGACHAAYTVVRLNGDIGQVFSNWIQAAFPHRAEKVLRQIAACHGGRLNDSRPELRMKGEGPFAQHIARLFSVSKRKYLGDRAMPSYNLTLFQRPVLNGQLRLF